MKIALALLSAGMALGLAACGGTTPPPQTSDNGTIHAENGVSVAPTVAPNATPTPSAPTNAAPAPSAAANRQTLVGDAPPADAQFTIFCDAFRGPNHVIAATAVKDRLMGHDGMKAWHILHTDDASTIFYGYYSSFDDRLHNPQETARAQADLKRIEAIKNTQGDRLFARAIFLPINNPDPDAPPQWNLLNTPADRYWSLQIGAYQGSPERKAAAVEAVREARARGIEAYYYHGETISSVCVGAWPIDAIKRQEQSTAAVSDPNDIPLVLNDQIAPIVNNMHDREGHHLVVEAPKLEILDGTLAATIRKFPEHAVNGDVMWKTAANGQKFPSPSFLVIIPHNHASAEAVLPLASPKISASKGADEAANAIINEVQPGQSNRGHLNSIDDK